MAQILATGNARKMKTELADPVQYTMLLGDSQVALNQYLGRHLQLSYQVNKTLRTWVTYGILEENEAGALSGNTLLGALPSADFSQDDVQAASINLAVSF